MNEKEERRKRASSQSLNKKKSKRKNSLFHWTFSERFPSLPLLRSHGQPHRRAGRGIQSASSITLSQHACVRAGKEANDRERRRGVAAGRRPRAMADFRCPVFLVNVAASCSLCPCSVLSLTSTKSGDRRDLDPLFLCTRVLVDEAERLRLDERSIRDTRAAIACLCQLTSPLISTRPTTGGLRPLRQGRRRHHHDERARHRHALAGPEPDGGGAAGAFV